jgi:hypothetical protein
VLLQYVPPHPQVVGLTIVNFRRHFPCPEGTAAPTRAMAVVQELLAKYPEALSV